jgi:hypothetical protein
MIENGYQNPGLHPILLALSIVLHLNQDPGEISRSHGIVTQHGLYRSDVDFPLGIVDLPEEDRWWEALGK